MEPLARASSRTGGRCDGGTQFCGPLRQRVILDSELAALYGVTTKRLNEHAKRNAERFPEDLKFRLTVREIEALNRSQIATGSQKHRGIGFAADTG